MKLQGKIFKYGDHVDTDAIIPAQYMAFTDADVLAQHCMEDIDNEFVSKVEKGDIIVAGINFGCGSSREHAPIAIKGSGVSCVIAKSFARIFFRNALNIGLPIVECPDAVDAISNGDTVSVDADSGVITNITTGETFTSQPFPEFLQRIIKAGGLLSAVSRQLKENK